MRYYILSILSMLVQRQQLIYLQCKWIIHLLSLSENAYFLHKFFELESLKRLIFPPRSHLDGSGGKIIK